MTMDLEDRLWQELEAAAGREARRSPLRCRAAAGRAALPREALRPALAGLAVLAALAAGVVALDRPQPPAAPQIQRFHLPGAALSAGLAAYGSLWTYDVRDGAVLRIDPAARRVVARVPVSGMIPEVALAAGLDGVWAVGVHEVPHGEAPQHPPAATLLRIDPGTNGVSARVTLRTSQGATLVPLGVAVTPSAVWVWGQRGAHRVDRATLRVTAALSAGADSFRGFAATDEQAWVVTEQGRLLRYDARTGARLSSTASAPLDHAEELLAVPGALAYDRQDGSFGAVDRVTGRIRWSVRPGLAVTDARLAGGRLWLLTAEPRLLGVDPKTGRVGERIAVPAADARAVTESGATLLVTTRGGDVLEITP